MLFTCHLVGSKVRMENKLVHWYICMYGIFTYLFKKIILIAKRRKEIWSKHKLLYFRISRISRIRDVGKLKHKTVCTTRRLALRQQQTRDDESFMNAVIAELHCSFKSDVRRCFIIIFTYIYFLLFFFLNGINPYKVLK